MKTEAKKGRPTIPEELHRTVTAVRLNEAERVLMELAAQRAGLELATWIRMVALAEARRMK